jgi:hypothetical protein
MITGLIFAAKADSAAGQGGSGDLWQLAEAAGQQYHGESEFTWTENSSSVLDYHTEYVRQFGVRHMQDNFGVSWVAHQNKPREGEVRLRCCCPHR